MCPSSSSSERLRTTLGEPPSVGERARVAALPRVPPTLGPVLGSRHPGTHCCLAPIRLRATLPLDELSSYAVLAGQGLLPHHIRTADLAFTELMPCREGCCIHTSMQMLHE